MFALRPAETHAGTEISAGDPSARFAIACTRRDPCEKRDGCRCGRVIGVGSADDRPGMDRGGTGKAIS